MKKKDQTYSEDHLESTIQQYEKSILDGKDEYFDVDDIEALVDYYMENGESEKALKVVQLGISIHPNNADIKIAQAKIFLFTEKADEAELIYEYLATIEPDNCDIKILGGEIKLLHGEETEANKMFSDLIEEDSDYTCDVAYAYYDNFFYKEAIIYFEQEIEKETFKNVEVNFITDAAFCYQQLGQESKAIALYEKLLDEDPYCKEAWYNLGQLYFSAENYDKAVEAFDFAYVVGNDPQNLLQKGNALFQGNKLQTAIETYSAYGETGSDARKIALVFIGECYERMNDYDKAKEFYEKAISEDPNNLGALSGMCICCLEQNDYKEGIEYAERAIAIDPELPENWMYKAEGKLNLGNVDEALACYLKASELAPNFAECLFSIGNIYIDKGDYDKALEYYNRGSEINKDADKIALYYAITFYKKGDFLQSHTYLIESILKDPETRTIFFDICPEAKEDSLFKNLFEK
jgi:tetratricopeptide (TPR) repeat protein